MGISSMGGTGKTLRNDSGGRRGYYRIGAGIRFQFSGRFTGKLYSDSILWGRDYHGGSLYYYPLSKWKNSCGSGR